MDNFNFTREQLENFMMMTDGMNDYQGTSETFELYDEFCRDTFGQDWNELIGEWDDLYLLEFQPDVYVFLSTGIQTQYLKDWIEQGKEILSQILQEQE
jgi:hypothetical protein